MSESTRDLDFAALASQAAVGTGRRLAGAATAWLHYLQRAQMSAVLYQMTDKTLADIGIRRSEIPAYARRLTSGE